MRLLFFHGSMNIEIYAIHTNMFVFYGMLGLTFLEMIDVFLIMCRFFI
jgi:hypothetical protein